MDYDICDIKVSIAIVMIGNLSDKTAAVILQISIVTSVLMIYDPEIIPVMPFFFWERNCPSPCVVIRHCFRVCHHYLPEPEVFQRWLIERNENFPILFEKANQEDETTEGTKTTTDGWITTFGVLPYVLKFIEVTNETFTSVMEYDISTVFYVVTFEVLKAREQEKQIKRIQHGK